VEQVLHGSLESGFKASMCYERSSLPKVPENEVAVMFYRRLTRSEE
jgi:hypothetical protein